MRVVCDLEKATPVAFLDLYEEGDEWVKVKSCEDCPTEQRIKCCGNCPCIMPDGNCYWQAGENKKNLRKSLFCVVYPLPNKHISRCCLEYRCIKGSNKGKVRRIKDKLNVFVEETA